MNNWKYICGAEIGNAKWSILEVTNPNTPNDGKYVGTIEADTKYEAESKFKKENPNIENRVVAVKVKNSSVEEQNEKLFHSLEKDVEEKEEKNDEKIEKVGNADSEEEVSKQEFIKVAKQKGWSEAQIKDFIKQIEREGSKRMGNSSEYEILKQDPSKMHPAYKKAYEEALKKLSKEDEEFKKRFEREYGVKAKNEASDDKFAYVMREFDEGKLKTPDGKVVTDPAQAKAIAYSESKKTENGCARARNAMKK